MELINADKALSLGIVNRIPRRTKDATYQFAQDLQTCTSSFGANEKALNRTYDLSIENMTNQKPIYRQYVCKQSHRKA